MADIQFICDGSELTGIWGAESPDVLVTGGFALERTKIPKLLETVEAIKAKHALTPDCPVKWNVRDLDRALNIHGLIHLKVILLSKSDSLRTSLIDALVAEGATIFVSIIQAYSNKKQVLGTTKEELVGYSFGNLLMRAGLFCQERKASSVDFVLDWPDRNERGPFTKEYYAGWRNGKSAGTGASVTYHCGPLVKLGFAPSPMFAATEFDPRLQLADLIVGASREFVDFAIGKSKGGFGLDRFKTLCPIIYKADGMIMGKGVTVSPVRSPFSDQIVEALKKL